MITRRKAIVLTVPSVALVAAGCAPAPAATSKQAVAPAAPPAPAANKLLLAADTVQGSKNVPEEARATKACVLSNRFPRNAEIVWRVKIFDPASGEGLSDKEAKAQVTLTNGMNIDLRYRVNRNDASEYFWSGSWLVPKDHPTGTLGYRVTSTDTQGRTGLFEPIRVPSSQLIITDEVLNDAAPKA